MPRATTSRSLRWWRRSIATTTPAASIYNELLILGFKVDVGIVEHPEKKDGKRVLNRYEVDFVCNRGSQRYYIQSAFAIPDEEKLAQG